MKNIALLLLTGILFLCNSNSSAQVPEKFNYQAVLRNNSGELISNQSVDIEISIIDEHSAGDILYTETHTKTTNAYGLVNLLIGTGVGTDDFSAINWAENDKFIQIKVNSTDMGTFQLLSVPYAMHAGSATNLGSENVYTGTDTLFVVKDAEGNPVFVVFPDGAKVIVEEATKGRVGGFAVSGRSPTKADETEIFHVTPDSTRIFVNDTIQSKGRIGGFAVSGRSPTKGITSEYLVVTQDSTRVYISDTTLNKGRVGGFAVSGRSPTKAEVKDYFNISGNTGADIINNEARIMWYPKKSALLAGEVHVGSADSVGTNSAAFGYQSISMGNQSQAFGYRSIALGDYSTAIGKNAIAYSENCFAFGDSAIAGTITQGNSYALGNRSKATGEGSYAFGYRSFAQGENSFSLGNQAEAIGIGSFAFGSFGDIASGFSTKTTKAIGNLSVSIGLGSQSFGMGSIAIGIDVESIGWGAFATGHSTTASGDYSFTTGLYSEASSAYSTAMGYESIASGFSTFANGYRCHAIGNYSVALGAGTRAYGPFSLAFGNGTRTDGECAIAIGESAHASGYKSIAIGTGIEAQGDYSFAIGLNYQNGTIVAQSNTMSIMGGKVGIGTVAPSELLDVDGNARFRSVGTGVSSNAPLYITSTGILSTAASDIRLKMNVVPLENGLESVLKLRGVRFNWKENPNGDKSIGFIAQEVEKVLPELVFTNEVDGYKGVNYAEMSAVLVEAVKQQQQTIETQKSKISDIENRLAKIEKLLMEK